jgi:hypothetical protein
MTRYRPQRGSLIDSLRLTVEVASFDELVARLRKEFSAVPFPFDRKEVEIKPYYDMPDPRIGWARTYIVLVQGQPVGFTDGLFEP